MQTRLALWPAALIALFAESSQCFCFSAHCAISCFAWGRLGKATGLRLKPWQMVTGASNEVLKTGGKLGEHILRPTCSYSAVQGRRQYMEDVVASSIPLEDISQASFFAVFDGHLGKKAALFAKDRLGKAVAEELASRASPHDALHRAFLKYFARSRSRCA